MKNSVTNHSTDECMRKVYSTLITDSKVAWNYDGPFDKLANFTTAQLREFIFPSKFCWTNAFQLKWHYQLESFLQRYRFKDEPYNDLQLEQMTLQKFKDNLSRVKKIDISGPLVCNVLSKAAQHVHRIVGEFDNEELLTSCKFGTKSTVGNPLAKSYLDIKLGGPLSGSWEQLEWFVDSYLPGDDILRNIVINSCDSIPLVVDSLKVTPVPKSWKISRAILANTLIGNFHSAGVGDMLVRRLSREGLNVAKLQEKHQEYVKKFSKSRSHVTADLSMASDSITRKLVKALMPKAWFNVLCLDSFDYVRVGKKKIENPCFCTMGIGFTFPLQTLIFYCLLLAIKELALCSSGFVSVYGDDLIYPREIHRHVKVILPLLGFNLNMDKTYVEEYFRESCGADFYRGTDVRPFRPLAGYAELSSKPYAEFCFKLINGLLRRWNPEEISITLHYLYREVACALGEIYVVPPSMPDTSGVKVDKPYFRHPNLAFSVPKWKHTFTKGLMDNRNGSWDFPHLGLERSHHRVDNVSPYYWDTLRAAHNVERVDVYASSRERLYLNRFRSPDGKHSQWAYCVPRRGFRTVVAVTSRWPTWA